MFPWDDHGDGHPSDTTLLNTLAPVLVAHGLLTHVGFAQPQDHWGVGGTVASDSALRSAGTLLSRVRAPTSATRPDGGP
ncbi:hypothetical protein PoB_003453100 [Plakobranchus ocellatus]|uniref:Uncharacterized protein n=1 Tax=Plakobranchus ocellatus TaxID=259542 RepID=A0AAV4AN70_9GAST|nr:hypothetical protein PoB_003453100 [Plakobranchus ocellatus]